MTLCIVGFDDLVTSFVATIAAGWSDPCRVGLPPTERPRLYAAHAEIPLIALSEIVEPLLGSDGRHVGTVLGVENDRIVVDQEAWTIRSTSPLWMQ